MSELSHTVAEKAVLAGLIQHGKDAFIDIDGIVHEGSFTLEENQIVWSCLKKLFEDSDVVDLPTLYGAAKAINLDSVFMERVPKDYYKRLDLINIELGNVKHQALNLAKFDVARQVDRTASEIKAKIREINGDETISEIISIGETPFFNFSSNLEGQVENRPIDIGEDIDEYVQLLIDNPKEMMGISTGFSRFDKAIGGGLRRGGVDLIAARAKAGKSLFAASVALHVAGNLGIPVIQRCLEKIISIACWPICAMFLSMIFLLVNLENLAAYKKESVRV